MTIVQTLYCEGKDNTCWRSFVRVGANTAHFYTAARAMNWQAKLGDSRDLCPQCKEEEMQANLSTGTCVTCQFHLKVEFRDSLGHDVAGHRTANTLGVQGIRTWNDLLALRAPHLRKLNGLGATALERITWAQAHPKERFR